jgi:hypothetical protein
MWAWRPTKKANIVSSVEDARLSEFLALSAKVSDKSASEEERARWRTLRNELAAGQRRAHRRARRKLRVHYAAVAEMALSFTDDVGAGGLRFRSHRRIEPGTMLVLHLDSPTEKSAALTLEARVTWSQREGGHFAIGVELPNLPPADVERLKALLDEK